MTWEEIKLIISTLYGQYVGSGLIIDDTDNGNTPSALAILFNLAHGRISSYPCEFNCLVETGTITLDGSTSYNLRTLFPGLKTVFQVYGIDDNQEHEYFDNSIGNITNGDGWHVKGNTLYFTGSAPTGTATIQYKSKYLVKSSADIRQQYFLNDADYSCLDEDDINTVIDAVGERINWKADTKNATKEKKTTDWFKEGLNNMVMNNKMTRQIDNLL